MTPILFLFTFFILDAVHGPACAEGPQTSLDDIKKFVDQIELEHAHKQQGDITSILSTLQKALKTDEALLELYLGAMQNVRFGSAEGAAEKMEQWKTSNLPMLQSSDFAAALRLHVMFLQSALLKKMGEEEKALEISSRIVTKVAAKLDEYGQYDVFRRPLRESPMINMGARGSLLQGIQDWYTGPLTNITELHRTNVIGMLRKLAKQAIFAEWEKNLQFEKSLAEKSPDPNAPVLFKKERLPFLQWQVAKDHARFKEHRKAMDLMVAVLKGNPTHPEFDKMLADLKLWVEEAQQVSLEK